jgi:hypothetical protein
LCRILRPGYGSPCASNVGRTVDDRIDNGRRDAGCGLGGDIVAAVRDSVPRGLDESGEFVSTSAALAWVASILSHRSHSTMRPSSYRSREGLAGSGADSRRIAADSRAWGESCPSSARPRCVGPDKPSVSEVTTSNSVGPPSEGTGRTSSPMPSPTWIRDAPRIVHADDDPLDAGAIDSLSPAPKSLDVTDADRVAVEVEVAIEDDLTDARHGSRPDRDSGVRYLTAGKDRHVPAVCGCRLVVQVQLGPRRRTQDQHWVIGVDLDRARQQRTSPFTWPAVGQPCLHVKPKRSPRR